MAVAGSYEMVSSENYDEYLKAVGVGVIKRGLAKTAKPTMTFTENNGKWTQKTTTAIKTFEITFTPGVEFDEETADGRTVKATITFEGNKLVHKQKDGKIEATTVREFNGDEMVTTFSSAGVTAVRKFKKV